MTQQFPHLFAPLRLGKYDLQSRIVVTGHAAQFYDEQKLPTEDMANSIGANHVIDYTQEDFTHGGQSYDLVFDNVENRSLPDCRRVLTPSGILILNSGSEGRGIGTLVRLVKPLVLSPFVRQSLRRYLSVPNHEDLAVLKELVESGKLTPVIDKTYPLRETKQQ